MKAVRLACGRPTVAASATNQPARSPLGPSEIHIHLSAGEDSLELSCSTVDGQFSRCANRKQIGTKIASGSLSKSLKQAKSSMKVTSRKVANHMAPTRIHMDTRLVLLLVSLALAALASASPLKNSTVAQDPSSQPTSKSGTANSSAVSANKLSVPVSWVPIKVNQTADDQSKEVKVKAGESRWRAAGKKSSPTLVQAKANRSSEFGGQAQTSILRPSFLRGLIGQRQPAESEGESKEEEEEEVTQTIMVPMGGGEQAEQTDQAGQQVRPPKLRGQQTQQVARARYPLSGFEQFQQFHSMQDQQEVQPKPEASLQLTSTEINGILNDREAPELYREREMSNDGVLVREEQAHRLGVAASNRIQGSFGGYGGYGGLGGFGGDGLDAFTGHRLAHSASEYPGAGGNPGGFHHRFGASSEGYSQDELGQSGRLVQSPNEYSEVGANTFGGSEYSSAGGQGNGNAGYESSDFSPNSGMLYAGSGDQSANSIGGAELMGQFEGNTGGGGTDSFSYRGAGEQFAGHSGTSYPGAGTLDRHASEMFNSAGHPGAHGGGGGSFGRTDMSAMYGQSNGRLLSAGSHQPNSFGADEFTGRFGHSAGGAGVPFDQRGFATQNSFMLRGNSMLAASTSGNDKRSPKLVPLSPEIPLAEEVANMDAAASAARETSSGSGEQGRASQGANGFRSAPPVVHEAIEDDDTASEGSRAEGSDGTYDGSSSSMNNGGGDDDDPDSSARSARDDRAQQQQQTPNLVLNVPPPNADMGGRQTNGYLPSVEFTRIGSAGYLAPNLDRKRTFTRKANLDELERRQRHSHYDPANNPAHAGKYIID